jgi:hypothetical protein
VVHHQQVAGSGILLSNPSFWRKGIAGLTHMYRTWFAFAVLGLTHIVTEYVEDNIGSGQALRSVGYIDSGRQHRLHYINGRYRDQVLLTCYNPLKSALLWPDGDIPAEVMSGLQRTQQVLDQVRKTLQAR